MVGSGIETDPRHAAGFPLAAPWDYMQHGAASYQIPAIPPAGVPSAPAQGQAVSSPTAWGAALDPDLARSPPPLPRLRSSGACNTAPAPAPCPANSGNPQPEPVGFLQLMAAMARAASEEAATPQSQRTADEAALLRASTALQAPGGGVQSMTSALDNAAVSPLLRHQYTPWPPPQTTQAANCPTALDPPPMPPMSYKLRLWLASVDAQQAKQAKAEASAIQQMEHMHAELIAAAEEVRVSQRLRTELHAAADGKIVAEAAKEAAAAREAELRVELQALQDVQSQIQRADDERQQAMSTLRQGFADQEQQRRDLAEENHTLKRQINNLGLELQELREQVGMRKGLERELAETRLLCEELQGDNSHLRAAIDQKDLAIEQLEAERKLRSHERMHQPFERRSSLLKEAGQPPLANLSEAMDPPKASRTSPRAPSKSPQRIGVSRTHSHLPIASSSVHRPSPVAHQSTTILASQADHTVNVQDVSTPSNYRKSVQRAQTHGLGFYGKTKMPMGSSANLQTLTPVRSEAGRNHLTPPEVIAEPAHSARSSSVGSSGPKFRVDLTKSDMRGL